jgi:hypothetical protein
VYSGFECEFAEDEGTLEYQTDGAARNAHSTEDMLLICPIARLSRTSTIYDVQMRVDDGHANESVDCTLKCRNPANTAFYSDQQVTSGTGTFKSLNFDQIDEYADGACYLTCSLPDVDSSSSRIINYMVDYCSIP